MRAVVVYESMYGNTHLIADSIGKGLSQSYDVAVVPVDQADAALADGADLLVVGGPTHVHGMSRESTRKAAVEEAGKPDKDLELDPDAEGPGLRDWFDGLDALDVKAAAFDTRIDVSPVLSGRASKGIAKRLRKHGCELAVDPESFLVSKESHLEPHEDERAREWGATVAARASTGSPTA